MSLRTPHKLTRKTEENTEANGKKEKNWILQSLVCRRGVEGTVWVGWVGRARHHWGGDGHHRQDDDKVVGYQKNYFKCFNDTKSFSIHKGIRITGNNIA